LQTLGSEGKSSNSNKQIIMTKQTKRSSTAYVPSPTSKPVLQKKTDSKGTPNKTGFNVIGRVQEEMEEYGESLWCAAENLCKNTLKAATSELVCNGCNHNIHNDCCKYGQNNNSIYILCLKCLQISQRATGESNNVIEI
jgi:hypothetical protein